MSGKTEALATTGDLYKSKAVLIVASDLAQQHPFLAFQIRANFRHHGAHVYTVTPGPVARTKNRLAQLRRGCRAGSWRLWNRSRYLLKAEPELVIVFGDAIKGDAVRKLVEFGDSLGIPVRYLAGWIIPTPAARPTWVSRPILGRV